MQLTQEVKPTDLGRRGQHADWILARQAGDENFVNRILFLEKANFHRNRYVNNQNCQVWGTENTQVFVEKKIYPLGTTVWSAYWAKGLICHFLFEDDKEATIIDNEDQYCSRL